MPQSPEHLAELQERFTAMLPKIDAAASFSFRHLHGEARKEAQAESRALAWRNFLEIAERGKHDPVEMAGMIGQFAGLKAAEGRSISNRRNTSDLLSPACKRKHGFRLDSLPLGDEEANPKVLHALRDTREPAPDAEVQAKLDVHSWIERQSPRRQEVARLLADGLTAGEVGRQRGVTTGAVTLLRREMAQQYFAERER